MSHAGSISGIQCVQAPPRSSIFPNMKFLGASIRAAGCSSLQGGWVVDVVPHKDCNTQRGRMRVQADCVVPSCAVFGREGIKQGRSTASCSRPTARIKTMCPRGCNSHRFSKGFACPGAAVRLEVFFSSGAIRFGRRAGVDMQFTGDLQKKENHFFIFTLFLNVQEKNVKVCKIDASRWCTPCGSRGSFLKFFCILFFDMFSKKRMLKA